MKKTIIYILIAALFYTFSIPVQSSALDDLSEGNRLKSEGDCAAAIGHYDAARRMGTFKDDTAYYMVVADCYLNIKNYNKAVESYTAAIRAASNKSILGEMYLGRGKVYFHMSSTQSGPDMLMIRLARNDLREAQRLGLDVRDIERDISNEADKFRAEAGTGKNSGGTVSSALVNVIKNPMTLVVADGKYVLYISRDTKLIDMDGKTITTYELKPGDTLDFSYSSGYRDKADEMLHVSVNTVLLNRKISPDEKVGDPADAKAAEKRYNAIIDKLDKIEKTMAAMRSSVAVNKQYQDNNTSAASITKDNNNSGEKTLKSVGRNKKRKSPDKTKNLKDTADKNTKQITPAKNGLKL